MQPDATVIVPLEDRHARSAAELHRLAIGTGFLSSLGPSFLRELYKAIPRCGGFGYVCQDSSNEVLGFIACAPDTGRLYKRILIRRGLRMAWPLARFLVRPATLRRIWQTLRYPAQVGAELPAAEVLSIAVGSQCRGRGLGKSLMQAALNEFARRGIDRVKVAVWAENKPANAFYLAHGFALAVQRKHHGLDMNVYVAPTRRSGG